MSVQHAPMVVMAAFWNGLKCGCCSLANMFVWLPTTSSCSPRPRSLAIGSNILPRPRSMRNTVGWCRWLRPFARLPLLGCTRGWPVVVVIVVVVVVVGAFVGA